MKPILVTGGTGTLGSLVVARLRAGDCKVRILARSSHIPSEGVEFVKGDLATGEGIEPAVEGAEIIIHCAGSSKGDADKARNLVRAVSKSGARHLVFISVVGADRAKFDYFTSKLAAERIIAESGIPWTTLRATQFHTLVLMVAQQMSKLPIIPVPTGFKFQPVDAGEVAAHLVQLALGTPSGLVPDMAGPRIYEMSDLLRGYLQATHKRRRIVPLPLPGSAARTFREGANLAPERAVGKRTWEEFLADTFA